MHRGRSACGVVGVVGVGSTLRPAPCPQPEVDARTSLPRRTASLARPGGTQPGFRPAASQPSASSQIASRLVGAICEIRSAASCIPVEPPRIARHWPTLDPKPGRLPDTPTALANHVKHEVSLSVWPGVRATPRLATPRLAARHTADTTQPDVAEQIGAMQPWLVLELLGADW